MKSPKVKGIGEVVTEYGAKVMKIFKKGLLQRSLFDFYGDVKANAIRVKESSSVPQTPVDNDGGVVYVKDTDGKLYYKSNEVSEIELSASDNVLTTEQVQDIAGPLVATGGTKTGITITYDDANGDMDFVVDHDAATNFVAEEHYRWDNDIQSTATINHLNLSSDTPGETEVLVINDGDAVWGHPEKIHIQVRNDEGSTISAGEPLYSKGEIGSSNRILVGVCDANDSAKMPCIGIAHSEMNTTSTKDNFAVVSGIYNTNISGFTSLAVGDNLYIQDDGSLSQTKPTGETSLIQNVAIVLRTNGSICQGMLVSAIGRTNDVPNLNSGYIFYGNGSNQAVSTQLSTLLPPDLTVDGAGTIHVNNVPTLNQNTTGNAATVTNGVYTSGNQTIADTKTFSSTLTYSGANNHSLSLNNTSATGSPFISFNQNGSRKSFIQHNDTGDTIKIASEYGRISLQTGVSGAETAYLDIENDGVIRFGAVDADSVLTTDGNMTFRIDADNDETSQKFIFQNNTGTEIASLSESGVLDLEGVIRPDITFIKILPRDFIPDDVGRPVQMDDSTSSRFIKSHNTAKMYASVDIPQGFKATTVDVYGSGTSNMTVYEANINSGSPTSLGNGSIGTTFTISSGLQSNDTNYLLIELSQTSLEKVYGGKVTIAKI